MHAGSARYATGATVFATAEASKLERVVQLGADRAIDYRTRDFAAVVARKTDGRGVEVVIDFVGEPYISRNITSLAHGGRLVQVGILGGGGQVSVDLETILYRHIQIIGTVMKSRAQAEKYAMVRRFSTGSLAAGVSDLLSTARILWHATRMPTDAWSRRGMWGNHPDDELSCGDALPDSFRPGWLRLVEFQPSIAGD